MSEPESWKPVGRRDAGRATSAMSFPGGCLVMVTTRQNSYRSEALAFVPGVRLVGWDSGGWSLEPIVQEVP